MVCYYSIFTFEFIKFYDPVLIGEPLHMLRIFGADVEALDKIDENSLTGEEMRAICIAM